MKHKKEKLQNLNPITPITNFDVNEFKKQLEILRNKLKSKNERVKWDKK
jgi:hypothetical protein